MNFSYYTILLVTLFSSCNCFQNIETYARKHEQLQSHIGRKNRHPGAMRNGANTRDGRFSAGSGSGAIGGRMNVRHNKIGARLSVSGDDINMMKGKASSSSSPSVYGRALKNKFSTRNIKSSSSSSYGQEAELNDYNMQMENMKDAMMMQPADVKYIDTFHGSIHDKNENEQLYYEKYAMQENVLGIGNDEKAIRLNLTNTLTDTCNNRIQTAESNVFKLNPLSSNLKNTSTTTTTTTTTTAPMPNACKCESLKKSVCIFKNSEPSAIPGSRVIYDGCFKMSVAYDLQDSSICQALRYCEEKRCVAVYYDGKELSFIKCYYGELPVKKADSTHIIFTISDGC